MKRFHAGENVRPGLYFCPRQLSFRSVEVAEPLPGNDGESYVRLPILMLLVAGPLVGLAYIAFLPFIGFAAAVWLLGTRSAAGFRQLAHALHARRVRAARR